MKKFRVRLKKAHEESGKSVYRVQKDTGMSYNTINKYIKEDEVVVDYLANAVLVLINYYEANWRDPKVLDIVEVTEDDEETEIKTPELALSIA